jgi:hypothetical protein
MRITEYVLVTDNLTLKILNLINVIESAGGKAEIIKQTAASETQSRLRFSDSKA